METRPKLRSIEGGAGGGVPRSREPYGLDPAFEAAAVTLLCRSGSLWAKLGSALDAECLTSPVGQLALKAATDYATEVGKGPASLLLVIQRLTRWAQAGKTTPAKVAEVSDYFDAAEDAGLVAEEAVLAELTPILQRRATQAALKAGLDAFVKNEDLGKVEKALSQARSIGKVADVDGSILGGGAFEAIDALRLMERLPTGVSELDLLLDGGFPRGLAFFVGASGAGKSMTLAHCAAEAVYQQAHVGIVTLELAEEVQLARVIANLTGCPINDILYGRQARAKERLDQLLPQLGLLTVRYFSPRSTNVDDLFRWVEQREAKVGRKMDLLVVDYIDKLGTGGDDSTYKSQGDISDALRDYALSRSMFCLTASQAKRGGGKSGKAGENNLDLDDIADSMGKARVADVVVTLRKDEEQGTLDLFLAKNRLGKSRVGTGPLTQDEACGRSVVVNRDCGW